jgi:hypothetical protein
MDDRKILNEYFNTNQNDEDFNSNCGQDLIGKYEANKLYFDELLRSQKKEDVEFALRIKIYKYAAALVFNEEFIFDPHYSNYRSYGFLRDHDRFEDRETIEIEISNCRKALTILNECENDLRRLENIVKPSGVSDQFNKLYEHLFFIRAACYAKLGNFNKTCSEIKKLLKLNPSNENYIDWYKSTHIKTTDNYVSVLQIFFIAVVICTALVMGFAWDFFQRNDLVFMFLIFGGITGALLTVYFGSLKDYLIKKKNPVPKKKVRKAGKGEGGRKSPWEMTEGKGE